MQLADSESSPLTWWKVHEENFPVIGRQAKKYLCIPATSTASERVFSAGGNVVTCQLSLLKSATVNMLVFLTKNLKVWTMSSSWKKYIDIPVSLVLHILVHQSISVFTCSLKLYLVLCLFFNLSCCHLHYFEEMVVAFCYYICPLNVWVKCYVCENLH